MHDIHGNNRRIVKNTMVVNVSMFLNMLIRLLSSRLVSFVLWEQTTM